MKRMKDKINSINNLFSKEHSGMGGLYFITTNTICAVLMLTALQLSWNSEAVAMADNIAYIASINCTVNSYITETPAFTSTNPSIKKSKGGNYNPLQDFNTMLQEVGLSSSGSDSCDVSWDGRGTQIQFSEFETSLGTKVRPHRQESIIEDK